MSEIRSHEFIELKLEKSKINELTKRLENRGEVSKSAPNTADYLLSKRIEKRSQYELGTEERVNESKLFVDWSRLEKLDELKKELRAVNPHYEEGRNWKINCQRCVPTMEMRMRGYDVTAKEKPEKPGDEDLCYRPFDVWVQPEILKGRGNGKEDIEYAMTNWGDGARAQIVVTWKGTNSGHTFMAEQRNGKTEFYDPQTGNIDVSSYFKMVGDGTCHFCRIDKLDVTQKIKDCCREV